MPRPITVIATLSLSSITAYLISLTQFSQTYLLQLVALCAIPIVLFIKRPIYLIYHLSFLICLVVFATHGLSSPFFFLIYFLLFAISLQNLPSISLAFSLVIIILLGQSLNSSTSLISLFSLLFITPIVWLVGRLKLENQTQAQTIAVEETDFLFWLNLKCKTGTEKIIDAASQLLSSPQLNYTQKQLAQYIKDSAKSILSSARKLTKEINDEKE